MKPLIREGDISQEVADVQARLRALGLAIDDDTGIFGSSTRRALRAFQQRRGLIADGVVGVDTWRELVESSWRLGDRVLYLKYPPLRGDDVMSLQARLTALGFDSGSEDGIFGRDTDAALRAFQREYGVAEDGIAGPHSYTALEGLRINRPSTAAGLREELQRVAHAGVHETLIVIDPGHGGTDLGERSASGAWEADICWDLAERLTERLAGAGARVRFTRTEAEGPEDSERARRANSLGGDLFLSLHLNSHKEPTADGSSSYYFRTSAAGETLAESIQREVVGLGLKDCRSHPSSFALLKETRMPAVLLEPAHLSSPDNSKQLDDPEFRVALVSAITTGVRGYYEKAG